MAEKRAERDDADKHAPYFALRDALVAGGCPLCRLAFRASHRYLDTLNYEGVNNPGLRQELVEANGLCYRHGWQWTRMRGSALGIAIVYRNVIKQVSDAIAGQDKMRLLRRGGALNLAERLQAKRPCPACEREDGAVARTADLLLQHLQDPEIKSSYLQAGGLCLPHYRLVLTRAKETQAQELQDLQSGVYEKLLGELDEFIRKNDHRFANEPMGSEANSWTRAVAAAAGEPAAD